MGIRLRILIILGAVALVTIIINMIKKEKLELKYGLIWLITALVVILMAIFPEMINYLAEILDIYNPMNALFFVGICLLIIIIFSLTVAQSRNSQKNKNLAQKIALMEYKLEKYKSYEGVKNE